MAEVRPFRGIRYAASFDLDDVVSPPYDVLTAPEVDGLRAKSPYNATHVDLPTRPGEAATPADYVRAAEMFATWRREGALVRETEEALYLVEQTYCGPDGCRRTRRGFVARLVLADFADRVVLPHEKTHAGPKADRLALYRATHADISQVFLLYPDADGRVAAELSAASALLAREMWLAHDGDGNEHRVAAIRGERAERIAGLLRGQTLYIADGHHRYETALAYRDERRAAGDSSADTMMVYLCGMSDPGLAVFPTHRLVKGVDLPPVAEILDRLRPTFDVEAASFGDCDCERFVADGLRASENPSHVFGFVFPREAVCAVVRLRDLSALDRLADEGFSRVSANLTVTLLHYLILRDVCGVDPRQTEGRIDYVSDPVAAFARLAADDYVLGAFINATLVDEVKAIADRSETMPHKSTYFYPKLLTGMVFDALGD
jgi:uncharacterized protein (DUF1015 family)